MLNPNVIPIDFATDGLIPLDEIPTIDLSPLTRRLERFELDREDFGHGITAKLYRSYATNSRLSERRTLYGRLLGKVEQKLLEPMCLLPFVIFEPHRSLAADSVADYLRHRHCDVTDEFAGVHEIIGILANEFTVNKGAVLAGLVSVGDRRINAVARAARQLLKPIDIRDFARVQSNSIKSSSVEFCLDWLVELNQDCSRLAINDLSCAIQLMAIHDQVGAVEDVTENNYVGLGPTQVLQFKPFEGYFAEIKPILRYLASRDGFSEAIQNIIEVWESHREDAQDLRLVSGYS
ncbi:MAG: hypothetical protein AAF525_12195 [Pseudomonadota bacterium]